MSSPSDTPSDYSSCFFTQKYNEHLPVQVERALREEYDAQKGAIPKKERLRELSRDLKLSMARIRRWWTDDALACGTTVQDAQRQDKVIKVLNYLQRIEKTIAETDAVLQNQ